jgi:hypothetical protein
MVMAKENNNETKEGEKNQFDNGQRKGQPGL